MSIVEAACEEEVWPLIVEELNCILGERIYYVSVDFEYTICMP